MFHQFELSQKDSSALRKAWVLVRRGARFLPTKTERCVRIEPLISAGDSRDHGEYGEEEDKAGFCCIPKVVLEGEIHGVYAAFRENERPREIHRIQKQILALH